ncbi:MAG: hypothetical protein OXI17_15780 [Gammaproteobacteria bacterium]|nr:hypothetical protein [Gammaproteobacteria bacterium]
MKAEEYLPPLEDIGLEFVEVVEFGDIPHSVFQSPKGKRKVFQGVRGCTDEIPMIPARKFQDLLQKAKYLVDSA